VNHVGQVRGVLAERIVVSSDLDPFLSLRALASYSNLSVRTLRTYLTDPAHPLPCYRVGAKILVRRSEFDAWMRQHRHVGSSDVDRLVAEVFAQRRPERTR
jgi:excisionase family DNA binding protein